MACEGHFLFTLTNGVYTATLRNWTFVVACVTPGPTGWILTVTDNVGGVRVYASVAGSGCDPVLIIFTSVLIDCGTVTLALRTDLTPCIPITGSSSLPSVGGGSGSPLTRTFLGFNGVTNGTSNLFGTGPITVDDLLIVVVTTVGVDQSMLVTWGGSPLGEDVGMSLPGAAAIPGRVGIFSGVFSGSNNLRLTVSSPAFLGMQVITVRGLASRILDQTAVDAATSGIPSVGPTGTTTQALEYVESAFLMLGATGTNHPWSNGFVAGNAQSFTKDAEDVVLAEGYLLLGSVSSPEGALLTTTPDSWAGVVATYR